jgi:hypothetical protein
MKKKNQSNVTIIEPVKRGHGIMYSIATLNGILDPFEYCVLAAIVSCKPFGFNATQLRYFFRAGQEALSSGLGRLIEMGIVIRNTYNTYDSGTEGVGRPRLEYDYVVDFQRIEALVTAKKTEKAAEPAIEPARVPVALPQGNRPQAAAGPTVRPATLDGTHYAPNGAIPSGARAIGKSAKVHECHLSHQKIIMASDGYDAEHKEKLQPFLDKLARDGNVIADIDTFCDRFNAYLDVCAENAQRWELLNGVKVVLSTNSRAVNGLIKTLRTPFYTVSFEQYQEKFFALMDKQHEVNDKSAAKFVNELRETYNKGELERYFTNLPKSTKQ